MTSIQRRTGLLLAVAVLGASGMFFDADGWFGIDIGPVRATVLYGVLWLLLMHLARHSEAVFPADSPLAERQAWVCLVFVSLIVFHFCNFLVILPALGAEADQISNPASRRFGISLGMLMFAWIVVAGILRSQNREAVELDERDLRIQHAAGRFAHGLMACIMIGFVVLLATLPEQSRSWMRPLIIGNALIGLLIARTLAESTFKVLRYRCEPA